MLLAFSCRKKEKEKENNIYILKNSKYFYSKLILIREKDFPEISMIFFSNISFSSPTFETFRTSNCLFVCFPKKKIYIDS